MIQYPVCCKHILEEDLLVCLLYNSVDLSISLSHTRLYKLQKSAVLSLTIGSAKLFSSYMRLSKQVRTSCMLMNSICQLAMNYFLMARFVLNILHGSKKRWLGNIKHENDARLTQSSCDPTAIMHMSTHLRLS